MLENAKILGSIPSVRMNCFFIFVFFGGDFGIFEFFVGISGDEVSVMMMIID